MTVGAGSSGGGPDDPGPDPRGTTRGDEPSESSGRPSQRTTWKQPEDAHLDSLPPPPAIPSTADDHDDSGPLAWMAKNSVAANLLMLVLVVGGLLGLPTVKQEVFPEFDLDLVLIQVVYPGASPEEVEQGTTLAIEEAVRGLDGVKEVSSTSQEGIGTTTVELLVETDPDRALSDVKAAIDRITSFPDDVERPVISLATNRTQVINVVIHGDKSERELRMLAEEARDELLADPAITQVDLTAVRDHELSGEVPQANLRRYGLTIPQIANVVRASSVEVPGGEVKTDAGQVLVRTTERKLRGEELEDVVVLSRPDGTEVKLRDIATVVDGFVDTDQAAFYQGERAAMLSVFRIGDETPISVSNAVQSYVENKRGDLPAGVGIATLNDSSEIYQDRIDLLRRNAILGLILVMITLGLFLEIRLAGWVTLGIPVTFIGSILVFPQADVSINMISLFAFIVSLGLVVDDAIVAGESIFQERERGVPPLRAAIDGVRKVAAPIVFAVTTTCIAFAPLLLVPGVSGKFFRVIPIIVISVLLLSLVESLFILPAHLAHTGPPTTKGFLGLVNRGQQRVSDGLQAVIRGSYVPTVRWAVRNRLVTLAIALAALLATVGLVAGRRIGFTFMPKIDSDVIVATVRMPVGTPVDVTGEAVEQITSALEAEFAERGDPEMARYTRGVFHQVGAADNGGRGSGPFGGATSSGSHVGEVAVYMVPLGDRPFSSVSFAEAWRDRVGAIAGAETVKFRASGGPASGDPIAIQLSHPDSQTLEEAAETLATSLADYQGVTDIDAGFSTGKEQIDFQLTAAARALGIDENELARQLRGAFFGIEALRQQRGRDEVRVYVRRPEAERDSLQHLEDYVIRTADGGEIPLGEAAVFDRGRSYTEIKRVDGRRVLEVTADVARGVNANEVLADVETTILEDLQSGTPGLRASLVGDSENQRESLGSLGRNFLLALVGMYALLAIAFRSYFQPIAVLSAIPFGFIGAVLGHMLMGFELSIISMMGVVALAGVVVNDSLILVVACNTLRREGGDFLEAVVRAGAVRFRPILLTSLTTFFGLVPMITETSLQARFLIPMAISLGFGVLFATFVTLLLVPALYVIIEDSKNGISRFGGWLRGDDDAGATTASVGEERDEGVPAGATARTSLSSSLP